MSVKLAKTNEVNSKTLASVYSDYLLEGMGRNEKLMHVDTDLALALFKADVMNFIEKYPERMVDLGISEANAVGFGCGLSHAGYVPFVHSFGPFMSRRVADQVFISGAYSKSNVKLIATDPGVSGSFNGGTHMAFEDIAIMRAIPEVKVFDMTDNVAAKALFPLIEKEEGMCYIRLTRGGVADIYEEGTTFEIGKGNVLKEGTDVTIIAAGLMVAEALKASELLAAEGISAKVIDMFTINPIDRELVIKSAKETGAIVTAENHSVNGGLGDSVTKVVMAECIVPVERIGAQERFGQVGTVDFLKEEYNLTAGDIAKSAKLAISKKK